MIGDAIGQSRIKAICKWKIHISCIFMWTNNEPPGIRTHSGFINWRNVNLVKRAMFLQLGVECVQILNILLWRLWKSGCPDLLLFFGAWSQIDFKSRLGDTDFLACWQEEDEFPLFLFLGDRINGEVISESGE